MSTDDFSHSLFGLSLHRRWACLSSRRGWGTTTCTSSASTTTLCRPFKRKSHSLGSSGATTTTMKNEGRENVEARECARWLVCGQEFVCSSHCLLSLPFWYMISLTQTRRQSSDGWALIIGGRWRSMAGPDTSGAEGKSCRGPVDNFYSRSELAVASKNTRRDKSRNRDHLYLLSIPENWPRVARSILHCGVARQIESWRCCHL